MGAGVGVATRSGARRRAPCGAARRGRGVGRRARPALPREPRVSALPEGMTTAASGAPGILTHGPLRAVILRLALPAVVMMACHFSFGLIDAVWVGRLIGPAALAAVSTAGFYTWILLSLGGDGGGRVDRRGSAASWRGIPRAGGAHRRRGGVVRARRGCRCQRRRPGADRPDLPSDDGSGGRRLPGAHLPHDLARRGPPRLRVLRRRGDLPGLRRYAHARVAGRGLGGAVADARPAGDSAGGSGSGAQC